MIPLSPNTATIKAAVEAERDLTDERIAEWLSPRANPVTAALWLGVPAAVLLVVAAVVWWAA